MKTIEIIYVFIIIILVVIKEGYQVQWGLSTDKKTLSGIWHFLGGLTRAFIPLILIPVFFPDYKLITVLLLCYCNLAYTLYDGWIAIRLGENFWYEGATAKFDKIFSQKVQTIFKIILFALTIGMIIFYLLLK